MEKLHSALRSARNADMKTYAPPGRLRRYDAIIRDEAPQVEDRVTNLFLCGELELPQTPALVVAADDEQLRPTGHHGQKSVMEQLS